MTSWAPGTGQTDLQQAPEAQVRSCGSVEMKIWQTISDSAGMLRDLQLALDQRPYLCFLRDQRDSTTHY